jgi:predicted site-specific integrase-resolvase
MNWITLEEVCEHTRFSESTVERWIKSAYLLQGIHYGGRGKLRRFDPEMIDAAVRFQEDPQAHEQAITAKRQALFGQKRA